jgi:pimeloyl-ACP methyl ester carboxylesterase
MHAFMYLFGDEQVSGRNPFDPQFRGACELYNAGLEGALRIARKQGGLRPGHVCSVQTATRRIDVAMVLRTQSWREEDCDRFEFVSDYQVHGLKNHYHNYGLGTPLIAIRNASAESPAQERFYPAELAFPVTALLRVQPARTTDSASAPDRAVLELYDPLESANATIAGQAVPLESDLSTPLAVFLNQPQLDEQRLATLGLLNPSAADEITGLYMLEPYRPGKIPVLMVHGLWSTPVTWMEMFNDLRSDPEIRRYYQFWFYLYPTGQPFWLSAARLRRDLAEVRETLDPHKEQPALDQLVLVGHSMGGLVSKLQTVDSGDRFWRTVSDRSFAQLRASDDVRARLASVFFFQPSPSIRRVVTIGTPHRGSDFANDTTRWLGRKLIAVPARFFMGREALLRDNPNFFRSQSFFEIQTSIDSLAPESPLFPVLLEADTAPWVRYHNVIGRRPEPGLLEKFAGEGDGIVSLASASLNGAASQIIVPADHMGVHRHPRSILEVRRVLVEHLGELRGLQSREARLPKTEQEAKMRNAG